jgi:hypothetical protein
MKRLATLFTVTLVTLLSIASLVGCGYQQEVGTYTGHGVSFDYPQDWIRVDASDPEALWVVAFQEGGSGTEPGVAVKAYNMAGMTLREFEQTHPWAFTNVNYTTSIVDVTINGRDAIRFSWTAELWGLSLKGDDIYITKDYEVVYQASCYALTSEYSTVQDAFNTLLDSFKIE